jgi:hypothetical protein
MANAAQIRDLSYQDVTRNSAMQFNQCPAPNWSFVDKPIDIQRRVLFQSGIGSHGRFHHVDIHQAVVARYQDRVHGRNRTQLGRSMRHELETGGLTSGQRALPLE